jgi:hypothetical protein
MEGMTDVRLVEPDRSDFRMILSTLAYEPRNPGPAYFATPVKPAQSTDPKLVMADGSRRTRKRRMVGSEPDAGKGKAVDNRAHRTDRPPRRARSATPVHERLRREAERAMPRGETPSASTDPFPSASEESSDGSVEGESELDEDYEGSD